MERHKPVVVILLNSIMFTLGHILNPNVTLVSIVSLFLISVLFTYPMLYMKNSLWFAFGLHTAWNFCQNIVFGLPNSGMIFPYSVFRGNAETARNSFAYNVGFGIEGSWLAAIFIAGVCVILYAYAYKRKLKPELLLSRSQATEVGKI